MLKKSLSLSLLLVLALGISQTSFAQRRTTSSRSSGGGGNDYNTGLGVRVDFGTGGAWFGFDAKHFFSGHDAGEASLLFGTGLTILGLDYQYHGDISGAAGLRWYAGMGLMLGFASGGGTTAFGLRPQGGLEYKISGAPIALGFDWRPIIYLNSNVTDRFEAGRFGLAARFTLN